VTAALPEDRTNDLTRRPNTRHSPAGRPDPRETGIPLKTRCAGNPRTEGSNPSPSAALNDSSPRYVESIQSEDATITVLIPEIVPSKRRHEIVHNQRGRLLDSSKRAPTASSSRRCRCISTTERTPAAPR
jgi:hypothetical protein